MNLLEIGIFVGFLVNLITIFVFIFKIGNFAGTVTASLSSIDGHIRRMTEAINDERNERREDIQSLWKRVNAHD